MLILIGRRHGRGKHRYVDGSVYDGDWMNGMRHGSGTMWDSTGNVIHDGYWSSGNIDRGLIDFIRISQWLRYFFNWYLFKIKCTIHKCINILKVILVYFFTKQLFRISLYAGTNIIVKWDMCSISSRISHLVYLDSIESFKICTSIQ
jgi:hypothetical protein